MAIFLSPSPRQRFVDINGDPLVGGKIYTYYAGTLNPAPTYANKSGSENANPIILDSAGKCDIWIPDNIAMKYVVYDADDVLIETIDKISIPEASGGGGGGGDGALRAGTVTISSAASSFTVSFSTPVDDTAYRVSASVNNLTDTDPTFIIPLISNKTVNGFTVKLSSPTDSANYKLEYSIHADV